MTTEIKYKEAKDVAAVEPQEMYTARLEFRSVGDTPHVQPFFSYSHHFPENYAGPWPAAFLALRDIGLMLAAEARMVYHQMDDVPEDPDERAALAIGLAQAEDDKQRH